MAGLMGGTDTSAQDEQLRQNAENRAFIEQLTQRARDDALSLFGPQMEAGRQGFQGALDVQRQAVPRQFEAFQQGNINAQNIEAAGLRGHRAALMGNPVDMSYTPHRIGYDTSFLDQQLPANPYTPELHAQLSEQPDPYWAASGFPRGGEGPGVAPRSGVDYSGRMGLQNQGRGMIDPRTAAMADPGLPQNFDWQAFLNDPANQDLLADPRIQQALGGT